jgi:hypothetical protein
MTHTEPILAWRSWRLRIDPETEAVVPVLESCVYGDPWPERAPFAAFCPEHELPHPSCGCGIYAVTSRVAALEWAGWAQSALPNPIVLGRVQLWGRLLPHSAGYRAQLAYPYELGVLASGTIGAADARRLERLLQAGYLVDIAERAA